jgi:dTDP-4-dehydrorhamnose 3,5-epimerase
MQIEPLEIPDVLLITPSKRSDARGFFSEVFRNDLLVQAGVEAAFVQDNHVVSLQRGVLRGLHFQDEPSAQGKLVRCTQGTILDVAVDIRQGSPTFGRHISAEISADSWRQLWIPPGFAHGYVTLAETCEVLYKVTAYYDPARDRGVAWNDPDLGIDWRLPDSDLILSDKDRSHPRLCQAQTFRDAA